MSFSSSGFISSANLLLGLAFSRIFSSTWVMAASCSDRFMGLIFVCSAAAAGSLTVSAYTEAEGVLWLYR